MKLMPKSLFGRALLVILGLLLLMELTTALLTRIYINGVVAERTAEIVVRLRDQKPDTKLVPPSLSRRLDNYMVRKLAQSLQSRFGPQAQAHLLLDPVLTLWMYIPEGKTGQWLTLPIDELERQLGYFLLILALSLCFYALVAAAIFSRRINRPLRQLAHAAAHLAKGESVLPLNFNQAHEFKMLGDAFDRMSEDIQKLEEDRRLLLAGVSHDLRTPLARLRLSTSLLEGEAEKNLLEGMNRDIEDMDAIIHQFLAFAEDGRNEQIENRTVAEFINEILEPYRSHIKKLEIQTGPSIRLLVRPLSFKRMLTNLLENAQKYGGGEIVVVLAIQEGQLIIRIMDRGPGIAGKNIDRMLEPFQRGHHDKQLKPGTGLGLATALRMAKQHGGQLTLHNRRHGGLEARLQFPIAVD